MKGSKKQPRTSALVVPGVDLGQLERLLSFMSEHGLEEFEYAHGDLRIRLKKAIVPPALPAAVAGRALPAPAETAVSGMPAPPPSVRPETASPVPAAADSTPLASPTEELHLIKSPIVGTFYASPNPEAQPFVKVGDRVEAGQTVCIIEAMKLMNEIEADVGGEVVRILVENGHPVEYGEPLFALRPGEKPE